MKTQITDFDFKFAGYGHYTVTYTNPITEKQWKSITIDMELIDATKNEDYPKLVDLNKLKRICKR